MNFGIARLWNKMLNRILASDFLPIWNTNQEPKLHFNAGIENFGVILKGKSVEKIGMVYENYADCFLVNNFDKEMALLEKYMVNKNVVHFVNRLLTAPLAPENYRKLRIKDIQLTKTSAVGDVDFKRAILHYRFLGLKTHYLPERLLQYNQAFSSEYANKYPNTGVLAIIYALDIVRPKHLWIVGLDLYQHDYLFRRSHQSPLHKQREKMKRIDMINVFRNVAQRFSSTKIHLVTYYDGFQESENLVIY